MPSDLIKHREGFGHPDALPEKLRYLRPFLRGALLFLRSFCRQDQRAGDAAVDAQPRRHDDLVNMV